MGESSSTTGSDADAEQARHYTTVDVSVPARSRNPQHRASCICGWHAETGRRFEMQAWTDARRHVVEARGYDPVTADPCNWCGRGGRVRFVDLRADCLGLPWLHAHCERTWRRIGLEWTQPVYAYRSFSDAHGRHLRGLHAPTQADWASTERWCVLCVRETPRRDDKASHSIIRTHDDPPIPREPADAAAQLAKAREFIHVAERAHEARMYDATVLNSLYSAISAANGVALTIAPSTSVEEDMDRLTALFRHARVEGNSDAGQALLQLVIEADEQQRRRATPEEATYAVVDAGRVLYWARKAIARGDS